MPTVAVVINTIVFILVLSFLVLIHELGHFLAARWQKIKVEEFGLGYPPRAKTLFTKWGTIFSLNWIPFGGFVRMEGEDELVPEKGTHPSKSKSSQKIGPFYSKSAIARLMVILAGATVNILFGILAFAIAFSFLGIPAGAQIVEVDPESPAAQAGLTPGMVITGMEVADREYSIRTTNEVASIVAAHYGQPVAVVVQGICDQRLCSDAQRFDVQLRTEDQVTAEKGGLGIFQSDFAQFYPWYEMPFRGIWFGLEQAVVLGFLIVQSLGQMITDLITKAILPAEVMGPVGIVHQATRNDLAAQGPVAILLFAGLISINLGIMNVLPIPALDGGRAVFILLEKALGKRHIEKIEHYANYGGYAFLLILIFLITARDIFRIAVGG